MLGIYLINKYLRLTNLENDTINVIEEFELPDTTENLFSYSLSSDNLINTISLIINDVFKNLNIYPRFINLCLDSDLFFLTTIPIDYRENKETISSKIKWEMANFYPETFLNFKINYYKLTQTLFSEKIYNTLIIGIDNRKVEIIKNLEKKAGIKFNNIFIDQLSSEKYIKKYYADIFGGDNVLLIGLKKNRVDLSIFNQKGLITYDYYLFDSQESLEESIKLYIDLLYKISIKMPEKICVYGEGNVNYITNSLSGSFSSKYIYLPNPLSKIKYESISNKDIDINDNWYRFLPSIGSVI